MSGEQIAVGASDNVHSVIDAMRIAEENVLADASKFNEDGSPKDPAGEKADTDKTAAAGGEGDKGKPEGVLTADGKHIMPYSVVTSAREAQANAEREAREAGEREREAIAAAEALRADLARAKAGDVVTDDAAAATEDNLKTLREQADAIRETLPAMAGMFDTLIKEVEGTRARLAKHDEIETQRAESVEQDAATAKAEVTRRVRTAIDNNPTLASWEATNVPAFNRAVDFDEMLKNDPTWQGKSFDDRFSHAVKLTMFDMPSAKEATAPKKSSTETDADVKARAEKALKDAGDPKVAGLSDLPGGAPPGGNPLENVEAMPTSALANKMSGWTNKQIQEFMAKYG